MTKSQGVLETSNFVTSWSEGRVPGNPGCAHSPVGSAVSLRGQRRHHTVVRAGGAAMTLRELHGETQAARGQPSRLKQQRKSERSVRMDSTAHRAVGWKCREHPFVLK